jgi:hypothetical protein
MSRSIMRFTTINAVAALINNNVDNLTCNEYIETISPIRESGGIGRRTGLRIQPALADRGSNPLSRTNFAYTLIYERIM